MDIEEFFESIPFARLLGVEVTRIADGHAEGRIEMRKELSRDTGRVMTRDGATFTLTDTVGGAALVSEIGQPASTIDMRTDYLNTRTGNLRAEADVVRLGGNVGTVDVDMYATGGNHVATARGIYETG